MNYLFKLFLLSQFEVNFILEQNSKQTNFVFCFYLSAHATKETNAWLITYFGNFIFGFLVTLVS